MTLLLVGCGERVTTVATHVEVPSADVDRSTLDLTDYGLTLNRVVEGEKLRPRALLNSKALLDRFFAQVAVVGPASTPELFPTIEARLAYALNCHTAALLRSLVALSTETTVPERLPLGFEHRFAFQVDGQWQTVAGLRAHAKGLAGDDWRVVLALPTVSGDGPAIVNRPYLPELLDAQLDRIVRDALASERVARLDHGEIKQILFWSEFWALRRRLTSDFERRYQTTDVRLLNVLLEWAKSGFRRETLNSAVGYAEHAMPHDSKIPWNGVIVRDKN